MKRHWALVAALGAAGILVLTLLGGEGSLAALAPAGTPRQAAPVVIDEVAWMGTPCSTYDEWIELYNNTAAPVNLTGWVLRAADGTPTIVLAGTIPAGGFFLLERIDDTTVADLPADQVYSGALENTGEVLELVDATAAVVDAVDASGGWPAGTSDPDRSMERVDPAAPGGSANWATNDGLTRNGLDCNGDPIDGTPGAPNSAWPQTGADLRVDKRGPATALPGGTLTYTIALSNAGQFVAHNVHLTDVLPLQTQLLFHTAPYPAHQPRPGTLVWDLGTVATSTAPLIFTLTCRVSPEANGALRNTITATSSSPELDLADNHDAVTTQVGEEPALSVVLIDALYYDGYAAYDDDEAIRLLNLSAQPVDLGGWSLSDRADRSRADRAAAVFPPGTILAPGQAIWCAQKAGAFQAHFGFPPDFEIGDTDPAVPEMAGAWPTLGNDGGRCLLRDAGGDVVDVLVYGDGDPFLSGWDGSPVEPWTPSTYFGAEGQILYRKRHPATGLPLSDTGTAADWAQDPADHIDGRKVRYPGWDLDRFFHTTRLTETAVLTVAVAPDHLLETILPLVRQAQESIWIQAYTLESAPLAQALLDRLAAGVSVTLLLEGSPAGGAEPAQGWICGQIAAAGGQVYFMHSGMAPRRYRFQHAKVLLVDDRLVMIGSENLTPSSMPADDKGDGTAGRRGVYLIADAAGLAARIRDLLVADLDPVHHGDLVTCAGRPELCIGAPPLPEPAWTSYTVAFTDPLTVQGEFAFEIVQSPENSLRAGDSLLGLVGRVGAGDIVLIEQFYEHAAWGPAGGSPETDPNPRLEAYLDAARRGAAVRILLNSFAFGGYESENAAAVAYLRAVAAREGLDLQVRPGNPTRLGLHNKMVLVRAGGQGYVHVGSLNGSEAASKINREVALQVRSDAAYDYLQAVFEHDWQRSPLFAYLPLAARGFRAPRPADHLLVGEVYYAETKEREWVEILNPTDASIDLSGFKLGDAEREGVFEGMYAFPPGTVLGPRQMLVVAASAVAFGQTYGRPPDFEFYPTDLAVPNLAPDLEWGTGEWELGYGGDEVLLLDPLGQPVDVVVYGDGSYHGVLPHPGVGHSSHSLERYPPLLDSDDCSLDFRDWPFPNPGELP